MSLTALLTGGAAHGREVLVPLEALPARIDWVSESGTVPYERVAFTTHYRPSTVLAALATPTRKKARRANGADPKMTAATPDAKAAPPARKAAAKKRTLAAEFSAGQE